MQDTKQTALDFLSDAEEFIVMTNDAVLADSSYPTIKLMIETACKQPQLKAIIFKTVQDIMRRDMLPMLN